MRDPRLPESSFTAAQMRQAEAASRVRRGAGHRGRPVGPALCATVLFYEYEDWPRGRVVFDRSRDLFIVYADRKLLTPATIARIATHFHVPAGRTEIQSDWRYQSTETPTGLGT